MPYATMLMRPPNREGALAVVNEYGAAWEAQDPARITRLFAVDAVYTERP